MTRPDYEYVFRDGIEISVREAYMFPYGTVYNGEISIDGIRVFEVTKCATKEECKERLYDDVVNRLDSHKKEVERLNKIKKVMVSFKENK